MKKLGFTVAELLITIGIIGIIASIMTGVFIHVKPDSDKVLYLQSYDSLLKTVKELASNTSLFPVCENSNNLNCQSHPLFNTMQGLKSEYSSIGSGDEKLCQGLAFVLNIQNSSSLNCANQPIKYTDGNWQPSFTTMNNVEWLVSTARSLNGSNAEYQTDVYIDINGPKAPNCIYGTTCTKPDRFKFMIAANGTIVPADPVGKAYIEARKTFTKKSVSIPAGSAVDISLETSLKNFVLQSCSTQGNSGPGGTNPAQPEEPNCTNPNGKLPLNITAEFGGVFNGPYGEWQLYYINDDIYIEKFIYELADGTPGCISKIGDGTEPIITMKGVFKNGAAQVETIQGNSRYGGYNFAEGYGPDDVKLCTFSNDDGPPRIKRYETYFTVNGIKYKDCYEDNKYFYGDI